MDIPHSHLLVCYLCMVLVGNLLGNLGIWYVRICNLNYFAPEITLLQPGIELEIAFGLRGRTVRKMDITPVSIFFVRKGDIRFECVPE